MSVVCDGFSETADLSDAKCVSLRNEIISVNGTYHSILVNPQTSNSSINDTENTLIVLDIPLTNEESWIANVVSLTNFIGFLFLIALCSCYFVHQTNQIFYEKKAKSLKMKQEMQSAKAVKGESNDLKVSLNQSENKDANKDEKNNEDRDDDSVIDENKIASMDEINDKIQTDLTLDAKEYVSICGKACSKGISEAWKKKSMYFVLLPFMLDTATDLGVVVQFYFMSVSQDLCLLEMPYLDMNVVFLLSAASLIFYRLLMGIYICVIGINLNIKQKIERFFIALLDLEIIRTIHLNYILNSKKPSNPQRLIQVLEACFEAAPQATIQTVYLWQSKQFFHFDSSLCPLFCFFYYFF